MDDKIAIEKSLEKKRILKHLNNLMGIISGLICDDHLHEAEVNFLSTWMSEHPELALEYPASIIYRRVREVLSDGVISSVERDYLLEEFKILSGTNFLETGAALPEHIASVFDSDPHVIIPDNNFVFTGKFLWGTRASCERAVVQRGGYFSDRITLTTNYLVVGSMSSPDWITENFGRKIQKAAEMAESGEFEISIIREPDWVMVLG